ncbi:hypothetical protein RJ495_005105 [Pluralibacter gergoviae]|nr:hypothetical protein [Pluralibacter gergoviae]ELD4303991.1 hypothetical protein [Pluralibacter gergoviae]
MAQGLQAWNAQGQIVVDLGDYNMRYVGSTQLYIGQGQGGPWNIGWGGVRPNGWLAIMRTDGYFNDFYAIPGNDSFTVQYLPSGGTYEQTLTFDIYRYD